MKMRFLDFQIGWLGLLACLLAVQAFAGETGKIAGHVVDKKTGEPLPGANVLIIGSNMGAATDVNGDYFIINIPPGTYEVKATFVGYQAEIKSEVRVFVDKTTHVDFMLSPQALEGQEVVVVAYRPETVEKDLTATRQSYAVSDVDKLPGISDVQDIVGLQADVSGGHFRGGRAGEASYLVGGASIINPLNNERAFDPIALGLEQVEVYTSGFSAEYGNVQSGVVNMVAKEGPDDKWETHMDVASTNSYYKTWGGSVYSPNYILYFNRLNSTKEWTYGTDPISGVVLWAHFGLSFDRYLPEPPITWPPSHLTPEDSMRTADLIRILWLQSVRETGLEYDKPDYRLQFSSGGPIGKNTTMFVAAQQNIVQPFLPTGQPNIFRQASVNLTTRPNLSNKVKITYNYDNHFNNAITSNYYRWFERVLNVTKQVHNAHQAGVAWNHVLNKATFIDVKLSYLYTRDEDFIDLLGDTAITEIYTNRINWRDYTAPTGYQVGKMQTSSGKEVTKTIALNSSITSQINKNNLLKAGLQFNYYDLNVNYTRSRNNLSNMRLESYHNFPFEGALYLQDKMEFEGLIANIGFRFDFYNLNTQYFLDKFSPYRNPNYDPADPSKGGFYDAEAAAKEETPLRTFFQPRIGISFPISERAVLHLNYGVFTQRPAFEFVYVNRYKLDANPNYERLGNPRLEPEQTISYDVGLVHALPFGFYLDVSAYLKDVSNLLQFAVYEDNGGNRYFTFDNREYADIKGFHFNLEKQTGLFRGYVRYNLETTSGKSGSAIGSGARAEYFENDALQD
ncbi:MAG: TonB-dependent receptor, partial [Calditrichaeota bacterium]